MQLINGSQLSDTLKRQVLAVFCHRFTGEHKPQWANELRPDGQPYQPQFATDKDWLANTEFYITKKGQLSRKHRYCHSIFSRF